MNWSQIVNLLKRPFGRKDGTGRGKGIPGGGRRNINTGGCLRGRLGKGTGDGMGKGRNRKG